MKSLKKLTVTAIAAGAVAFSALSVAHPASSEKGGWHHGKPMHHGEVATSPMFEGRGFDRMSEKLELTDAQRDEIRKVIAESRDASKPLREKLHANIAAERAALEARASERELKKLARATADSRVELILSHRAVEEKISRLLTDDQRARLEQHRADRKAKMLDRIERRQSEAKDKDVVTE